MSFAAILLFSYLGLGIVYALYILLFAWDPWYAFPINAIGGPVVVYIVYITVTNRRLPWGM